MELTRPTEMRTSTPPHATVWRTVAVALAGWSLWYASYRAYYAAGGQFGSIGRFNSPVQWRAINAVGAAIILLAAVLPLASLRVRVLRRALPVLGWFAGAGCIMHALVDGTLRMLSLSGARPYQPPPGLWRSFDRHAADLQDLLLNEPWFLIDGLLWSALALAVIAPSRRRGWITTMATGCLVLTTVGILTGLGGIGSFRFL